jgi:hypothetical protein
MLGRAALLSRLTDMMPHATLYDRVLAEVRAHDQVFRARYFIDGDPLEDYLTALEIQTDAVKSPAIACIRDVRLSETTRVRDAAARAEWTLRHMLLEAFVDAPSAS